MLALNCGSSSLKFQVIDLSEHGGAPPPAHRVPGGTIEQIGPAATSTFTDPQGRTDRHAVRIDTHEQAVQHVIARLEKCHVAIDAVGHRVVHGGSRFTNAVLLDAAKVADIEALNELAPLHNPPCVSGIRAASAALGADRPMVAVFDTAFHHTLPDYASTYAIPAELAARYRIRRYGFHGIAHQSVVNRFHEVSGTPPEKAKLIILHLGNGCSAAAIRFGRSVDTSMGFTPLEGLVMGTRCGDLDPGVVGYLMRHVAASAQQVDEWLNRQSGLLGLSGLSSDMRELTGALHTDARARLAVAVFCYRAIKYVGAYLAALGGADALIFSGGIGEHSPLIRARICEPFGWCGLQLDPQRNTAAVATTGCISLPGPVQAYVIPADEELIIAQETRHCLQST